MMEREVASAFVMSRSQSRKKSPRTIAVSMTRDEVEDLASLAHYYERSFGVMRHVVRLTSNREMRQRFRFVAQESRWLADFAAATASDLSADPASVSFTPRSLIAFWGRALSSLNSKRSRRKL